MDTSEVEVEETGAATEMDAETYMEMGTDAEQETSGAKIIADSETAMDMDSK